MDTLVWDRVPGAAYGWQDMNRVAEAMEYVAERLHGYGFNLTVEPQRFTREDFPTPAAFEHYLAQLSRLRGAIALPLTVPPVPNVGRGKDYMTVQEANDIERILTVLDSLLTLMEGSFLRCGAAGVVCGARGLPTEGGYFVRTWAELDAEKWGWPEWDEKTWTQLSYRRR